MSPKQATIHPSCGLGVFVLILPWSAEAAHSLKIGTVNQIEELCLILMCIFEIEKVKWH